MSGLDVGRTRYRRLAALMTVFHAIATIGGAIAVIVAVVHYVS
jgi:hypothetical protein